MIAVLDKPAQKKAPTQEPLPNCINEIPTAAPTKKGERDAPVHLFVGYPLRPGATLENTEEFGALTFKLPTGYTFSYRHVESSEYCRNFNFLWRVAHNDPQHKFTHWGLNHDDVEGEITDGKGWGDILIDEMEKVGADVMAAVIAIKDHTGDTSTAIRDPLRGGVRRLSLKDIHERLPETFCIDDVRDAGIKIDNDDTLLINTGLFVVRLDKSCMRKFPGFETRHWIAENGEGQLVQGELTEDWNFSEWARRQGLKVFATRKVITSHFGDWVRNPDGTKKLAEDGKPFHYVFRNDSVWGTSADK